MLRTGLDDLIAFDVVARERSFTKAAAILGVSQSALSRSMRSLEERLGVRLLQRTTRSVAPTEIGHRLLSGLGPALATIDTELASLRDISGGPSGTLRVTAVRHAFETVLRPIMPGFLANFPGVRVEVSIEDGFTDIVAEGFDAGLRIGGLVEKDMIAILVGTPIETAVVASPGYLARMGVPNEPNDLFAHANINYRLASSGGIYPWRFERQRKTIDLRVEGAVILNDGDSILSTARDGIGMAYTFLDRVLDDIEAGNLVRVLADWSYHFPPYHLYHTSRRHVSPALRALIDALKPNRPSC